MNNLIKKGVAVTVILLFIGLAFAPSITADNGDMQNDIESIKNNDLPDLRLLGFEIKKHSNYGGYAVYGIVTNRGADYNHTIVVDSFVTLFILPILPIYDTSHHTSGLTQGETKSIHLFFLEWLPVFKVYWFHITVDIDGADANPFDNQVHRPFIIRGDRVIPKTVRL